MFAKILILIPVVLIVLFVILSCSSSKKYLYGVIDGKLAKCPNTSNCVSSDVKSCDSSVKPFVFTGSSNAAWKNLNKAVNETGGKIITNDNNYLWAVYTSRIFRFKDDLECRMDYKNHVIQIRSASRVGYSDFGVNRNRIRVLREKFTQNQDKGIQN